MKFIEYFKFLHRRVKLTWVSLILSLFTLVAYHVPFFSYAGGNIEGGFNKIVIFISLGLLMLAANFFFYYLVLYLGRAIGKGLLALLFVLNSATFYFIVTYDVLINASMMGNVFNTRYSESSGFFSWTMVLYIIVFGLLPSAYVCMQKIDYGKVKRFFANIGIGLGICLAVGIGNMSNWPWIDKNASELGSLLMPWSYTINSLRWWNSEREKNRQEILLPDAKIGSDRKDVCVLIIGESARRENFSLYEYQRETNPLMKADSVTALKANSDATYTTAGVKAILDHKSTGDLYEILPNYLTRTGVHVNWRANNWGQPPLHVTKYEEVPDLKKKYPGSDDRFDGILTEGLEKEIRESGKDKVFIVLHTTTSHGPAYFQHYPPEFEKFKPVCTTVEMSKADHKELINAYDNTILYTDWLVHKVISTLRDMPDWRSMVLFVSDHGESLGERNLYMHGVPMAMAPKEQIEIPFIVWTSDKELTVDPRQEATQYNVFHSVLRFLDIESPVYNPDLDIFCPVKEKKE